MKKIKNAKKLLMIVFAAVLVCAVSFTTVLATNAPKSITVKRAEVVSDLVTNKDHGFTIFETSDGKNIYCLDNLKKPLVSGQTATLSGSADDGILYILKNGYPNKKVTGNEEMDFYITQAAIWWYMDETGQGSNKLSDEFKNSTKDINGLLPIIKDMVAKAKSYKDNQVKPNMVVKTNGDTLTLTKDKKYYESGLMTATLTGASTYSVSVSGAPKGTTVVNEKGEAKTSFASKEQVKVRVPVGAVQDKTNMTVKFTASGKVQKAMVYKTNNSEYQSVAGLYDEVVPLEQTTKLVVTPKPHVCEIDGDEYYGINGTVVDADTYDKECNEHVCEIVGDKYYGINGTIVDEKTYDKECNKHVCEIVDDQYYGANGTIVDENTFNSECGDEVIVPNTSSNVSPLAIVMGLLMVVSGAGLIAYKSKMSCL